MNFDLTFPHYAKRMNQYILVIAVIGAGILFAWQGWAYAIAWGLGCLFHIFFSASCWLSLTSGRETSEK